MNNDNLYTLKDINMEDLLIPIDNVIDQKFNAELYQCMLQFHLPLEPIQCETCDSLICKLCLQALQVKDDKCPTCREKLKTKGISRLIKVTLSNFTIKCLNTGCKDEITYDKFIQHYITCNYTPREAECTGCNNIIKTTNSLKEITEHNKNCNFKDICKFCFKSIFHKDMEKHYEVCEERETTCPYCNERFPFSGSLAHWSKKCFIVYIKNEKQKLYNIINNQDKVIYSANYENTELRKNLGDKDKQLKTAEQAVIDLKATLKDKDCLLKEKEKKLDDLRKELDEKEKIINKFRQNTSFDTNQNPNNFDFLWDLIQKGFSKQP
jgi:hypothetical protein